VTIGVKEDGNAADRLADIVLVSSVGVGVLEALEWALVDRAGLLTRTTAAVSDADWRAARAAGRIAAVRARLRGLLFPLTVRLGRRGGGPRVVVATTNPFWLPTMMALRQVRPLVVLVYDVYPDALAVRWDLPRCLRWTVEWVVGYGLRRADAVVVLGERIRATLVARHRLRGPVAVIPTGADPGEFIDVPTSALPAPVADDAVLIAYVGNTGSVHDGRTLGLALAEVLARRPEASAIVATRGDRADELLAPLGTAPRAALRATLDDDAFRATLARADVALVTLDEGAGVASLPSKVHPALAAGCAVLAVAPSDSDLADLVTASGAGLVVPPGDVPAATAALERLVADPALRARCAEAARRAAEDATPAVLAARWAEVLRPLLAD
jgi:glycosyltransferase involved in cell wall biosynthesis